MADFGHKWSILLHLAAVEHVNPFKCSIKWLKIETTIKIDLLLMMLNSLMVEAGDGSVMVMVTWPKVSQD